METVGFTPIVKVSEDDWIKAQKYESNTWIVNNRRNGYLKLFYKFIKALKKPLYFCKMIKNADFYCGDDWNYWWLKQFENYSLLPKKIGKSLEVGSGPYSNTRLISRQVKIDEIYCTDPLMDIYKTFKLTWIFENIKKGRIKALTGKAEQIDFTDNIFDLVICNNVLDHVQDANRCLNELLRVLKPGGYIVFGQELTDEEDMKLEQVRADVGHPIKLTAKFLDSYMDNRCRCRLKKELLRNEGRVPGWRGGTYIFIGIKI